MYSKSKLQRVFANRHDVWDIHTDTGRWWVLTKPMNFYSQKDFAGVDYILSFHIGLCSVGGASIGVGWAVGCVFALVVALTMGQLASAFPKAPVLAWVSRWGSE